MEKHSVSRLSYLFAHLYLLSSYSFSSDLLSSNLPLLSASALLCFSSLHIVGSLTSKLPSNIFMNDVCVCDRLCFFVRGIPIVVSSFHRLKTCPPHHSDPLLEKSSLRQRAGLHDPCLAISPPSAVISSDRRIGFQENLQYMVFTRKYRGVPEIFPSNSLESLAISGI